MNIVNPLGSFLSPKNRPHHQWLTIRLAFIRNAELPVRFLKRIFRAVLYSFPIKPRRKIKHRKAYLSLSVSVTFSDTFDACFAISHNLVMNCAYASVSSASVLNSNYGKLTISSDISILMSCVKNAR